MNKEIEERMCGINYLIHRVSINSEMINYLWFELFYYNKNIALNRGIVYLKDILMQNLIIEINKLLNSTEKFSFIKLLNICRDKGVIYLNYENMSSMITELSIEYASKYSTLRNQFFAHQDLKFETGKVKITELITFADKVITFFQYLSQLLNFEYIPKKKDTDTIEVAELKALFEKIFDIV